MECSLYVDNLNSDADEVEEGHNFFVTAKKLFVKAVLICV